MWEMTSPCGDDFSHPCPALAGLEIQTEARRGSKILLPNRLEQEMHAPSIASKPTSLKLPAALKTQLEDDAQRAGLSLHAYMVQTLADSVRRTRQREAFTQDSIIALSDLRTSGSGYELGNVRAYFSELASHRKGLRAKPQDLAPTPMSR